MAVNPHESPFSRTEALLGQEGIRLLQNATMAVFGVGGVGGSCAEALTRCGVGRLILVDNDRIQPSNLNRQVIALHSTLGMLKTEAMRARLLDINPELKIDTYPFFYSPETQDMVPLDSCDAVIDCVDTLEAKLLLAKKAQTDDYIFLSAMGAGFRQDPLRFRFADIYETKSCPLARRMRKACRERGIKSIRVLYSEEEPMPRKTDPGMLRPPPGSLPFVPPVAGLALAGEAVRLLLQKTVPGQVQGTPDDIG
ncbi:MAG: tRNA threonylcarbamoyladenosine dehydratase [Eubacteriales bacterium]|nr:tRNA threonylcarbamoyladenosine dehydratase [Eubacteriales bacterium]